MKKTLIFNCFFLLIIASNCYEPTRKSLPHKYAGQMHTPTKAYLKQYTSLLHKHLYASYGARKGSNSHPNFKGVDGIKKSLRFRKSKYEGDLTKFKLWSEKNQWKNFYVIINSSGHSRSIHYDWWMFPSDWESSQHTHEFQVFLEDIKILKKDIQFLSDYREGIRLVVASWGWNIDRKQPFVKPTIQQKWRYNETRLIKIVYSLIQWQQWDYYDSLREFFYYLKDKKNIAFKNPTLLKYF